MNFSSCSSEDSWQSDSVSEKHRRLRPRSVGQSNNKSFADNFPVLAYYKISNLTHFKLISRDGLWKPRLAFSDAVDLTGVVGVPLPVPQELVAVLNQFGTRLDESYYDDFEQDDDGWQRDGRELVLVVSSRLFEDTAKGDMHKRALNLVVWRKKGKRWEWNGRELVSVSPGLWRGTAGRFEVPSVRNSNTKRRI